MQDIMDKGVTRMTSLAVTYSTCFVDDLFYAVVEDIDKRRQPLRAFDAIYLLSPVDKVL
jgi:hypothetical protein